MVTVQREPDGGLRTAALFLAVLLLLGIPSWSSVAGAHSAALDLLFWGGFGSASDCQRAIARAARQCVKTSVTARLRCLAAAGTPTGCEHDELDLHSAAARDRARSMVASRCSAADLNVLLWSGLDDVQTHVATACAEVETAILSSLALPPSVTARDAASECQAAAAKTSIKFLAVSLSARARAFDRIATTDLLPSRKRTLVEVGATAADRARATWLDRVGRSCDRAQFVAAYGRSPESLVAALAGQSDCVAGTTYLQTAVQCPAPQCGNRVHERGEECDDGNEIDGDGCRRDCRSSTCRAAPSTFELIEQAIFVGHGCASDVCHGKAQYAGLDLRPGVSFEQLVGAAATSSRSLRVAPGAAEESVLWRRLAKATLARTDIVGSGMPLGLTPISGEELHALQLWIDAGAPRAGRVAAADVLLNACLDPGPAAAEPPRLQARPRSSKRESPPSACAGDCRGSSVVAESDLAAGITLMFDDAPPSDCPMSAFDRNGDGRVSGAELVGAVRNALSACSFNATPTPTPTPNACGEICNRAGEAGLGDRQRYGRGVAYADTDGDGWEDLWISDTDDRTRPEGFGLSALYHNQGDGTFVETDVGIDPDDLYLTWGESFGDYDNDGDPDLLLANGGYSGSSNLALYRNDLSQNGRFTRVTAEAGLTSDLLNWWSVAWADYDNDGWLDFAAVPLVGRALVYHNRHDGTFGEVSHALGIDLELAEGKNVVWIDYDLDGDQDVYLAGLYNHGFYRNDGSAGFVDVTSVLDSVKVAPTLAYVFAAAAEDFNQDGWPDLYMGQWDFQDVVMINQRDGTFARYGSEAGLDMLLFPTKIENTMGLGIGDIDEDGYPDVLIGTGRPQEADLDMVFCNDGAVDGVPVHFHRCAPQIVAGNGYGRTHGIVLGDPDHDGDTDIFYNLGGHPAGGFGGSNSEHEDQRQFSTFYRRQPAQRPCTATLKLVGTQSNRDAIGARVRVDGSSTRFYTRRSTQGFQSQNSPWLLVSLGEARQGTATITWPSGKVTTVAVHADERLEVVE